MRRWIASIKRKILSPTRLASPCFESVCLLCLSLVTEPATSPPFFSTPAVVSFPPTTTDRQPRLFHSSSSSHHPSSTALYPTRVGHGVWALQSSIIVPIPQLSRTHSHERLLAHAHASIHLAQLPLISSITCLHYYCRRIRFTHLVQCQEECFPNPTGTSW